MRAVASVAGDGSELESDDNGDLGSELEREAASWWKSGCGIEKGLCMPFAEPMGGSRSMEPAADMVTAMEEKEETRASELLLPSEGSGSRSSEGCRMSSWCSDSSLSSVEASWSLST